jgi:hypothetical protein
MKSPASALLVDKMSDLIVLMRTKPRDPAGLAVRAPQGRVDAAGVIQRCDQFTAVTATPGRMARLARKLKPDPAELRGSCTDFLAVALMYPLLRQGDIKVGAVMDARTVRVVPPDTCSRKRECPPSP